MSYAANDAELFRRAAIFVDKILKGTKPADLPVAEPAARSRDKKNLDILNCLCYG
jgi:ABC-type uncharacterized transport system substrate-binding protein